MVNASRPLDELVILAAANASGEFICTSPVGEIHAFLQDGRIAWAIDSRHPFAFAAHLQEAAGIDVETFRRVVQDCRRDKLPLGETLVARRLTTLEGVRKSLAHQIGQALSLLATVDGVQPLFLERAYRKYDYRLTFGVQEFIGDRAPVRDALPALPVVDAPALADRTDLARQLRTLVDGVTWVEVFEDDRMVDANPSSLAPRTPPDLVRTTVLDGADFVAVRAARNSVVGLSLCHPQSRSVWCRISADSTFGAVVAAVCSVVAVSRSSNPATTRPDVATWSLGSEASGPNTIIRSFMQRADDVLAAVVLAAHGDHAPLAGCGSSALESRQCLDLAQRRRRSIAVALGSLTAGDDVSERLDSSGFYLKTMVSGEAHLWCFGAELAGGESLWLFLHRGTSQGLGWAYLAALTRALSQAATTVPTR